MTPVPRPSISGTTSLIISGYIQERNLLDVPCPIAENAFLKRPTSLNINKYTKGAGDEQKGEADMTTMRYSQLTLILM